MGDGTLQTWTTQTRMTDPGRHGEAISRLPAGVAALIRSVQGLLIHAEELEAYGVAPPPADASRRATRPVADRLAALLDGDAHPLAEARAPSARSTGTCRDYALMLCSFLRHGGIPARVRCGFAAYFTADWHDHWICEHWDAARSAWCIADAQMDDVLRRRYGAAFDPADVPRALFRTAGEAWSGWRSGREDPARYGHGAVTGPWFIKVDVVRDHLALNGREVSAWDGWRDAPPGRRTVATGELEGLDRIAGRPDLPGGERVPDWLTGPAE